VEQVSLTRPGRGIAITGMFFAGAALWIYGLVLGAFGIACGAYAMMRGDRLGRIVVVVAAACGVAGFFLQKLPEHFFG